MFRQQRDGDFPLFVYPCTNSPEEEIYWKTTSFFDMSQKVPTTLSFAFIMKKNKQMIEQWLNK